MSTSRTDNPKSVTSKFWEALCRHTVGLPPSEATLVPPPRLPPLMPCVVAAAGLVIECLRPILITAILSAPLLAETHQMRRPLMVLAACVIGVMLWMRVRYRLGSRDIHPGIYGHFEEEEGMGKRVQHTLQRALKRYKPTPYLFNGHLRTIIPHVLMHGTLPPPQGLHRRWLPLDAQYIGLDILLPPEGDTPKGVVILLHGLNGGSTESYVVDMYKACQARRFIACCMLGRGLAGTPFTGGPKDTFCPSRISDVATLINMLHSCCGPSLPVYLVGWSLGGVVAANVVAKCGSTLKDVLAGCIVVSGGLRIWEIFDSKCAVELWHPLLAFELKRSLLWRMVSLTGYEPPEDHHKDWYYTCHDLLQVETALVAPAHGFDSVWDYYRAMSADDDGRCEDIAVPTLIIHAVDDPVIHVDSAGPRFKDSSNRSPYLYAVITPTGGHVGWPQGWLPWTQGFGWISNTALDFAETVVADKYAD